MGTLLIFITLIWLGTGIRQVIDNQQTIVDNQQAIAKHQEAIAKHQEKLGEGLLTISNTIKDGIIETNKIIDENFKMVDDMMNDVSGDKN